MASRNAIDIISNVPEIMIFFFSNRQIQSEIFRNSNLQKKEGQTPPMSEKKHCYIAIVQLQDFYLFSIRRSISKNAGHMDRAKQNSHFYIAVYQNLMSHFNFLELTFIQARKI